MPRLTLVSHPLPVAWDGRAVTWDRWERVPPIFICPPPKDDRCECGSNEAPFRSTGLREPHPEKVAAAESLPRLGRSTKLTYPTRDLHAMRCPDCGRVEVWDTETNELWTLDESDYGPDGSTPPSEWNGGLFDLLPDN